MPFPAERVIGCGRLFLSAVRISSRLFVYFLAAMGAVLFLSDQPVTWAQAWPYGIGLWIMAVGANCIFTGRF